MGQRLRAQISNVHALVRGTVDKLKCGSGLDLPKEVVTMKIGSIVICCYEFDKMLAFWQEALHYVPREPAKDGWVVLRDPKRRGPNVSLDQVPDRRSGKRNRLHLDLYTSDRESEVERLIKLGARRYPWRYQP